MKLKRREKTGFADSSASSDIAFLLIIYFIVIAGFNVNKGFLMNLPAKDSTRLIQKDSLLRFAMDSDGNLDHRENIIGVREAGNIISAAQKDNPNIAVLLTIDRQAKWQHVVAFIELAQDRRIDSFSFSMKKDAP